MISTLIQSQYVGIQILPESVRGRFWLKGMNDNGQLVPLVSVEGVEDQWIAKPVSQVTIFDENSNPVKEVVLEPSSIYWLKADDIKDDLFVFVEPITPDRQTFSPFVVAEKQELIRLH